MMVFIRLFFCLILYGSFQCYFFYIKNKVVDTKRIRESILYRIISNIYIPIVSNKIEINIPILAAVDHRGIGRLTRIILKKYFSFASLFQTSNKKIFLYPSITLCPGKLIGESIIFALDTIPLELKFNSKQKALYWKRKYQAILTQKAKFATISEFSKKRLLHYFNFLAPKDVNVLYLGTDHLADIKSFKSVKQNNFLLPFREKDYFVYIGNSLGYKNLKIIIEAIGKHRALSNLVVVGLKNDKIASLANKLNVTDRIFFTGHVNDNNLSAIIKNSTFLVSPSLIEGFGLPPFEAAKFRIPSICSDIKIYRELLSNCCLYADPFIAKDWASKINHFSMDHKFRDKISNIAYKNLSKYKWDVFFGKLNILIYK